jgi:hypothetical protein
MSHRSIAGSLLLFAASSCLSSAPPPASKAPSDKAATASATDASTASADGCGKFKIQSKDQFEACNKKCKDDQQDQQRQCGDPQCQQGIGQGARICLGKCEEGEKQARAGKCYKE